MRLLTERYHVNRVPLHRPRVISKKDTWGQTISLDGDTSGSFFPPLRRPDVISISSVPHSFLPSNSLFSPALTSRYKCNVPGPCLDNREERERSLSKFGPIWTWLNYLHANLCLHSTSTCRMKTLLMSDSKYEIDVFEVHFRILIESLQDNIRWGMEMEDCSLSTFTQRGDK